jgi:hypothetical protein
LVSNEFVDFQYNFSTALEVTIIMYDRRNNSKKAKTKMA